MLTIASRDADRATAALPGYAASTSTTSLTEDRLGSVACAKEALNLEISALLYVLPIVGLFFLGPLAILGMVLTPVIVIVVIVGPIIAAVKAMSGESFRYPYIWHVFE